jgi:biopolymer transport protein ExbD
MRLKQIENTQLDMQVSALIDVVFLLLIYFMVTAVLIKKERDFSFQLPMEGASVDLPVEVFVLIGADGAIELDGMLFSNREGPLTELITRISSLKELAAAQHADFFVNIVPHQNTRHHRVIDVMDACAAVGVERVGFNKSS